jgi:cardiolipin synthase
MLTAHWVTHALFLLDLAIRLALAVRVIGRRLPVGVALAWLAVILILPFAGAVFYLIGGEYRLGRRRARLAAEIEAARRGRLAERAAGEAIDWAEHGETAAGLARLGRAALGAPAQPGNRLELFGGADAAFPALIADVDAAAQTCDFEFYIWSPGGRADELGAALIRAAKRGVTCRLLVDAVGSAAFLRSPLRKEMADAGVLIRAALPAGAVRLLVARPDLRLHRKIAVLDGSAAYTGSLNVADPLFFKQGAGVGQWVDALARVRGPAVEPLALTFLEDWALETGAPAEWVLQSKEARPQPAAGDAVVQVLPSGPGPAVDAIEQVVLTAVYGARHELVLTTPYFVPSESLQTALLSAAARGVDVTLVVPAKVDSRLVRYASRAPQTDLLAAGVRVALFQGGLLHTKSVTVDGRLSLFGSVNLDPRSLRLDFEITLAVYDAAFTRDLRALQQSYLDRSEMLTLDECRGRGALERFAENAARLAGPLL